MSTTGPIQDTLKLVVIGGTVETSTKGLGIGMEWVHRLSFFLTAHFNQEDYPYDWLMHWLSKQPAWGRSREFEITTRSISRHGITQSSTGDLDEEEEDDETLVHGRRKRKVAFMPSVDTTHTIYYRGHWLRITRTKRYPDYGHGASIKVSVVARNNDILKKLVLDAKREYEKDAEHRVHIFMADTTYGCWRWNGARQKRPMSSIVLQPGVKDMLLADCKDFLASEDWYAERGVHGVFGKDSDNNNNDGSTLSLSGLLNSLDGVAAAEGRLLFATTNHIERLDPALSRPGRMDVWVNFTHATKWQAEGIFKCFFPFQPKDTASSSSSSSSQSEPDASQRNLPGSKRKKATHAIPLLSEEEITELAKKFAEAIPEDELSVAALQGYLLKNKTRPRECVDEVAEWVISEREMREKLKKEKAEREAKEKKEAEEKEKKEREEKESKEKEQQEAKEKLERKERASKAKKVIRVDSATKSESSTSTSTTESTPASSSTPTAQSSETQSSSDSSSSSNSESENTTGVDADTEESVTSTEDESDKDASASAAAKKEKWVAVAVKGQQTSG
ncbi:hypothetical protein VNI00_016878 [Paramarasmius palmivorus]|uniref:BCS1 N-terminal domain-containing protein n=1 Tax=Paramarasmius palmivorus TaxID=297713 RepID=A0AAW0BAG8_9AGAR